jgi:hypothetical protein
MVQLLVTLIIPPVVGVATYYVLRRIWEREENCAIDHEGLVTTTGPAIAKNNDAKHDKQRPKTAMR